MRGSLLIFSVFVPFTLIVASYAFCINLERNNVDQETGFRKLIKQYRLVYPLFRFLISQIEIPAQLQVEKLEFLRFRRGLFSVIPLLFIGFSIRGLLEQSAAADVLSYVGMIVVMMLLLVLAWNFGSRISDYSDG